MEGDGSKRNLDACVTSLDSISLLAKEGGSCPDHPLLPHTFTHDTRASSTSETASSRSGGHPILLHQKPSLVCTYRTLFSVSLLSPLPRGGGLLAFFNRGLFAPPNQATRDCEWSHTETRQRRRRRDKLKRRRSAPKDPNPPHLSLDRTTSHGHSVRAILASSLFFSPSCRARI